MICTDLLNDLLERTGLDPESHHGEDGADGVHVDGVALAEVVEAFLQDVHLLNLQTDLILDLKSEIYG